jgi:ATP-dependent HslUV protease ATP-binding subunit HslU
MALMGTENVAVEFAPEGVRRIAEIAWQVNERTENIGARRLHTVMERLLDSLSFDAAERSGERIRIDDDYVEKALGTLAKDEDLSRYIL